MNECVLPKKCRKRFYSRIYFYENNFARKGGARWQVVDIAIAQRQLTTLKKEDQETPKGTHQVP
jgi:hypothetical protein